ncbi:MAG: hypothetical protein KDD44_00040, partial [Bdellovibrionales bacterium]|nr:hypothetical protein [Bdellovibrionales bacterium]
PQKRSRNLDNRVFLFAVGLLPIIAAMAEGLEYCSFRTASAVLAGGGSAGIALGPTGPFTCTPAAPTAAVPPLED